MIVSRRLFLKAGLGGGWLAAVRAPAGASASPGGRPGPEPRLTIVNADGLGMSEQIDRGIVEACRIRAPSGASSIGSSMSSCA